MSNYENFIMKKYEDMTKTDLLQLWNELQEEADRVSKAIDILEKLEKALEEQK